MLQIPLYGWLTCVGNSRKWKKHVIVSKKDPPREKISAAQKGGGEWVGDLFLEVEINWNSPFIISS